MRLLVERCYTCMLAKLLAPLTAVLGDTLPSSTALSFSTEHLTAFWRVDRREGVVRAV